MKSLFETFIFLFACCTVSLGGEGHRGMCRSDSSMSCSFVDGRYLLEIPRDVFGREMLFVTRLSRNAFGFEVYGAGKHLNLEPSIMFVFEEFRGRVLMRFVRPDISLEGGSESSGAIRQNNTSPIFYSFRILSSDSHRGLVVIDVSDLFAETIPWLDVPSKFGISRADRTHSGLTDVQVVEDGIEFTQLLTYRATRIPGNPTNVLTVEMIHTIVFLPMRRMVPRLAVVENRFDNITIENDFYFDHRRMHRYILRWRLEPSDWEAFSRGVLVPPQRAITFYVDPFLPAKWRAFVARGIEDWNIAFEQAGFAGAVRSVQVQDRRDNWQTPEMRAIVRYVPGSSAAVADLVYDPRTGEILQASVQLGQHKIESIADQFFIQTAASNPTVRGVMADSIKGQLVSALISHEVGHALGLAHYMGASRLYSVDSLRSSSFTARHGLSPSIMDYARGNYIAQPDDGVQNFGSKIGEADFWAIRYAYRPIEGVDCAEDEEYELKKVVQGSTLLCDDLPTDVDHELSSNSLYAAELGIKNLKTVMENMSRWSNEDKIKTADLYDRAFDQYELLVRSVASKLERYEIDNRFAAHDSLCLAFLSTHLFAPQQWLVVGGNRYRSLERIRTIRQKLLRSMLYRTFAVRVKGGDGDQIFSLLTLLSARVIGRMREGAPIGYDLRRMQEMLTTIMIEVRSGKVPKGFWTAEYEGIAYEVLVNLKSAILEGLKIQQEPLSRAHMIGLLARIDSGQLIGD